MENLAVGELDQSRLFGLGRGRRRLGLSCLRRRLRSARVLGFVLVSRVEEHTKRSQRGRRPSCCGRYGERRPRNEDILEVANGGMMPWEVN